MSVLHGDFIADGGIIWRAEDTRLYGYIADIPNFYERESLFTIEERTKLVTPPRLLVNVNNHGYIAEESYTLNLNSTAYYDAESVAMATPANRAGKDLYVYVVEKDDVEIPGFILSANSTVPASYNSINSRKIGGFHCLCESVGTIPGHTMSNYTRGDIIPYSIWDLKHRPVATPEGMSFVDGLNLWVDIYLNSWTGYILESLYQGVIADGNVDVGASWNGEKFVEALGKVGKRLPTRNEFMVFSKGSNERVNITGSSDPITAGGHVDSNSNRIISNYALEDCIGVQHQWTNDTHEFTPNATYGPGEFSLTGYELQRIPVFNADVDDVNFGQYNGIIRRVYVGGAWNSALASGSRSGGSDLLSSASSPMIAARGVSTPKAC